MTAASVPDTRAVLLVEDNPLVNMTTVEMLEELGYAVRQASDGKGALRELEHGQEIAVLIADVGLPDMNGYNLVSRARRRRPGLRVLFTTGYEQRPGGIPPDAITAYLQKPYQPSALEAALRRLLAA